MRRIPRRRCCCSASSCRWSSAWSVRIFAPQLLSLMGASAGVLGTAPFTRVMLGCNVSVVMLYLVNAVFRSAGDAAIAMRVLWLANASTSCSPGAGVRLGSVPEDGHRRRGDRDDDRARHGRAVRAQPSVPRRLAHSCPARSTSRFDPSLIARVVNLSSAATFQVFIGMASWIGLVRILASFGSDALAGYTIGMRDRDLRAAAIVRRRERGGHDGRSGARREEAGACRTGGVDGRRYSAVFLGLGGAAVRDFRGAGGADLHAGPGRGARTPSILRTVACGFLFYAYGMVITQSFNGAGDTRTPTLINLGLLGVRDAAGVGAGAHVRVRAAGAFLAVTMAFSLLAVVCAVLFRRGAWKTRIV